MPDEAPQPQDQSTDSTLPAQQPQLPAGEGPIEETPVEEAQPQEQEGPKLPEVAAVAEDAGKLKKKITVTVPRARIDAKFNDMFGELAHNAQVPGFRIGHAPRRLIEKRFGREVSQDVRNAIVGDSLGQGLEKVGLKSILGEPKIDLEKIELPDDGDLSFAFEVEVAPEFQLPELKGIKVHKETIQVTPQRVDQFLEQIRQSQARFEPSTGAAAEGDIVTAETTVTVEGSPPVENRDVKLRVAPGQVEGLPLVGLGKALSGRKAADTVEITVNVPSAHPNEAWREKTATVGIRITQVQHRVLPTDDQQVARSGGFESVQELREYVARRLAQQVQAEVRRSMREQVCQYLLERVKFDLPEGVAASHAADVLHRRYVDLLHQGVPRERIDENMTELTAAATEQAKHDLSLSFILGKVADQENIEVTDAQINARISAMARQYNRRPERLRQELQQDGSLDQVQVSLREEAALDKLLEQAEVTEVPAEEPDQAPQGAQEEPDEKP